MNLDDASKFHKSSVLHLYPLTLCPLHKIPMSKSKPKTCVSSPGSCVTWSSATNNTLNVSERDLCSSCSVCLWAVIAICLLPPAGRHEQTEHLHQT